MRRQVERFAVLARPLHELGRRRLEDAGCSDLACRALGRDELRVGDGGVAGLVARKGGRRRRRRPLLRARAWPERIVLVAQVRHEVREQRRRSGEPSKASQPRSDMPAAETPPDVPEAARASTDEKKRQETRGARARSQKRKPRPQPDREKRKSSLRSGRLACVPAPRLSLDTAGARRRSRSSSRPRQAHGRPLEAGQERAVGRPAGEAEAEVVVEGVRADAGLRRVCT